MEQQTTKPAKKIRTMREKVDLVRKSMLLYTFSILYFLLSENCKSLTKHKHFLLPFLGLAQMCACKRANIQVAAVRLSGVCASFLLHRIPGRLMWTLIYCCRLRVCGCVAYYYDNVQSIQQETGVPLS